MARGPLYQKKYRPQFSGHETFPLRYGWLKKVYDRVAETENEAQNKSACWGDDAIAIFGVGKNMVASMRHWATSAGIITELPGTNTVHTTELGQTLFGPRGLDPYMEHPSTLWLIHWQLAARPEKTTWFWAFNYYPAITFEREHLIKGLERLAKELGWSRVSNTTLKNDVSCFVRTYAAQQPSNQSGHDDTLESPLTELGIIKAIGKRDGFRFVRGPKATLGDGVFVYALIDFWSRFSNAATLSFEAITYEPGAPGRIFLLDENDIADRLATIDDITDGFLRWSETAGLKQIVRNSDLDSDKALSYVSLDYDQVIRRRRRNGAY
jgi:hypothetical protein